MLFPKLAMNEEEFVKLYMSGIMKNKLIIGRYLPMQSIIHQLDPRAKLIFVFFYSFNFFCHSLGTYAWLFLL